MFAMTRAGVMVRKAPPVTYATLNPADKGAAITLTNGNLTATASGAGGVRATRAVLTGEHKYWEILTNGASNSRFGLANSSWDVSGTFLGDGNSIGWLNGGILFNEAVEGESAALTFSPSDRLAIAFNRPGDVIQFYKNGTLVFTLSGRGFGSFALFPAFHAMGAGGAPQATFNFGPTMTYAIPSGASLLTV